jgi:hypothetical protein
LPVPVGAQSRGVCLVPCRIAPTRKDLGKCRSLLPRTKRPSYLLSLGPPQRVVHS